MTYEFGTLRPPTPIEMERRRVPLETLRVWWVGDKTGAATEDDAEPTVAELAEFMKAHTIPYGAQLRTGVFGIRLDWTHLELCEVCNMWTEPHGADDEFHVLMQRASDAWKSRSGFCELCKLTVVNMESHEEQPFHKGREKRRAETAS